MKTLYFECSMGARADTIAAALLELTKNKENIIETVNNLRNGSFGVVAKSAESCGTRGTGIFTVGESEVKTETDENGYSIRRHRTIRDMLDTVDDMPLNGRVRKNVLGIINLIAESAAETKGALKEEVHLHDLASLDNIMMIVTVCIIMDELAPEYVVSSPICLGMGYTHSVYGTIPVPTPATSYLLKGIPTYAGKFEGELCTTPGAAILKWFVKDFEQMPKMSVKKIGCGIGKEKYTSANCLRAFLGEIISTAANDEITELTCIIDDTTAGSVEFVQKQILDAGAKDVYSTPVHMQRGRIGIKITCICDENNADDLSFLMLKNTNASYVKRSSYMAYSLKNNIKTVDTSYGEVRVNSYTGYGIERIKPVYDDIEKIALKNNSTIEKTYNNILKEISKT